MTKSGILKTNENAFASVYRLLDLFIVSSLLYLSALVYSVDFDVHYQLIAVTTVGFYLYFSESFKLYRSWRVSSFKDMAVTSISVWISTFIAVLVLNFLIKQSEHFSRVVFTLWFIFTSITLISWRYIFSLLLRSMRKQGRNTRKVAIFGVTESAAKLMEEMRAHPEQGLVLAGFYDDRTEDRIDEQYRSQFLGNIEDAIRDANAGKFEQLYIALPLKQHERINEIVFKCGDATVDVFIVPDFFVFNLVNSRLGHVGDSPTLSVFESPHYGTNDWLKRLFDIAFSSLVLLLLLIPMLVIAVAIKTTSRGPVLFKQHRYGLDGKEIKVWKFRSMSTMDNGSEVKQATKGDARITKVGAFLRRTSMDEFPQFINVLTGSMSVVGPRPHAVAHNEEYRGKVDFYMLRHKVKPGITGWAQINGWRGETDTLEKMEKRVEHDLEYIRNWSIFFDLKIIFLTVFKGFVDKNAY